MIPRRNSPGSFRRSPRSKRSTNARPTNTRLSANTPSSRLARQPTVPCESEERGKPDFLESFVVRARFFVRLPKFTARTLEHRLDASGRIAARHTVEYAQEA